jgi:L-2-hydroxyglutarate oxidase LhgO
VEHTCITIIGAGVVGLAVASRLSEKYDNIILLEQHDGFGRETSSRNSEVIHAGFYYPQDSLKARLCVSGNRMTYDLCGQNNIPHKRVGKIVVANTAAEKEKLHALLEQGGKNGVPGLELLTKEQVQKLEPSVNAVLGLLSPSTGIVDTHLLMKYFETRSQSFGVTVGYNCRVFGLTRIGQEYAVAVVDADNEEIELRSEIVVNCAGLKSGAVASMAGIDSTKAAYTIRPCKGEYFSVSNRHRGRLSRLVYPAPTPISLGVHAVLKLDGSLKLGPNAFYVVSASATDYDVDPSHQKEFFEAARTYLPFLEFEDLSPDMAGIRPKTQARGETFRDFEIHEERDRGLPNLINLVGIESPGLTAAPAIAEHVCRIIEAL